MGILRIGRDQVERAEPPGVDKADPPAIFGLQRQMLVQGEGRIDQHPAGHAEMDQHGHAGIKAHQQKLAPAPEAQDLGAGQNSGNSGGIGQRRSGRCRVAARITRPVSRPSRPRMTVSTSGSSGIAKQGYKGSMQSDNPEQNIDFGFTTVPREKKRELVREVFNSVASKYDIMNDLMSLGVHRLWKREFISALDPRPHRTLLDLAGGTGDITFGWLKKGGGPAFLTDINAAMLGVGRDRATANGLLADITFLVTDAEAIPLPNSSVDRVSMAFGLRNCTNKDKVLAEARRVLKPGGKFLVLEFSKLQIAGLEKLYDTWSFEALPRLGQMVAGDAASYQYLAESIRMFPDQETLKAMMETAGLERVTYRNLSGGIAAIHQGWRL